MTTLLSRYVIKSTLFAMIGSVVGLWVLQMIFAYLSELENLSDTYHAIDALWYVVYRSPYFLVQFVSTGVLLGAVIGLGSLASSSELVVMRAAGISIYRIISWVMVPAMVFVVLALLVTQFVLPITNQLALGISNHHQQQSLVSVKGYWAIQPYQGGQDIVYIGYADNTGKLEQIKRFTMTDTGVLVQVLTAPWGEYSTQQQSDYVWRLHDVNELGIYATGVQHYHADKTFLKLPIAPTHVHLLTKDAEDLSLSDLYAHKQMMTHQGIRSLRHELSFWQKLLSPIAILALVLVASSFVFGSLRSQGLGLRIVLALLTGLLFSYLTDLMGFVALATGVSPMMMAILPIVISTMAGVYLLHRRP